MSDRRHRVKSNRSKWRGIPARLAVALALLLSACTKPDPNGDLSGSVFVVTAGAGAYKLALVKLYFCDENDVKDDLKAIANEFLHQDSDIFNSATKAESDNEAAKKTLAAANAKLANANAQNKKSEDAQSDLAKVQGDVDRLKAGIANLLEKDRPDVAKNWDSANQLAGEIMDQLYLDSGEKRISLEGLVAIFGCVVESSKNSTKSLREEMEMSVMLTQAFQILTPTASLGQAGQDTFSLFSGQADSVVGHALVGPDAGIDSSGSSIQSEYDTAVRGSDHDGIFNAISAGANHLLEAYKSSHPPAKPPDNNYSLSVLSSAFKEVGDSSAKLVSSCEADAKVAGDAQAKSEAKLRDLRAQLQSLPQKEAERCLALNTKAKFTAETDADGAFKLRLPKQGGYVVLATTQRTVGTQVETYFWLVPVKLDGRPAATLTLSNDNELFGKDGGGSKLIDLRPRHGDYQWKDSASP